jgi:hypothetical protein
VPIRFDRRVPLRSVAVLGLVLAIACGACSGGDDHDSGIDKDDWKLVKKKPSCDADNVWRVASYFHLARDVDYVADRINTEVISESGEACASASDREQCKTELATVPGDASMFAQLGHHLVTIEGDSVRIWIPQSALALLGEIDTPGEALWMLLAGQSYSVHCDAAIYETGEDGFAVAVDQIDGLCPKNLGFRTVTVSAQGNLIDGMVADQPAPKTGCLEPL